MGLRWTRPETLREGIGAMINNIVLVGRLTRDPELKYTPSGTAVATFTLAINRRFNKEQTDFVDIVAWRQSAEFIANYGGKGRLTGVEGRIQVRTYETKEGQKRKVMEVIADHVQLLDKAPTAQPPKSQVEDQWADLGREVRLEDLDMINSNDEDEIPF